MPKQSTDPSLRFDALHLEILRPHGIPRSLAPCSGRGSIHELGRESPFRDAACSRRRIGSPMPLLLCLGAEEDESTLLLLRKLAVKLLTVLGTYAKASSRGTTTPQCREQVKIAWSPRDA